MAQQPSNHTPLALSFTRFLFRILSPIMPHIMGRYAYHLWITPIRVSPPDRELPYMEKAKASYIIAEGLKIRVWSWGEGPTVLFIHGWGGRGTQISCFVDALNQAGFRVISMDLPAHGQSDGKQTNAFQVTKTVTEVLKKIDDLHTVITHSFGGIVFGYFYHSQLPLKKIIMLSSPSTLHAAFNQFSATLALPLNIQEGVIKKLKENFGNEVFERLSLVKNIEKASQPVLVIHDKQDAIVPYQEGEIVAKAAKRGTFHLTHDLGHRKVLYDKNVVDFVVEFISATS